MSHGQRAWGKTGEGGTFFSLTGHWDKKIPVLFIFYSFFFGCSSCFVATFPSSAFFNGSIHSPFWFLWNNSHKECLKKKNIKRERVLVDPFFLFPALLKSRRRGNRSRQDAQGHKLLTLKQKRQFTMRV